MTQTFDGWSEIAMQGVISNNAVKNLKSQDVRDIVSEVVILDSFISGGTSWPLKGYHRWEHVKDPYESRAPARGETLGVNVDSAKVKDHWARVASLSQDPLVLLRGLSHIYSSRSRPIKYGTRLQLDSNTSPFSSATLASGSDLLHAFSRAQLTFHSDLDEIIEERKAEKRKAEKRAEGREIVESSKWRRPCKALYFDLANENPPLLVKLIRSDFLAPTELTYALEALGSTKETIGVREILFSHLNHEKPYVREGAVYGLSGQIDLHDVREGLKSHLAHESSPGVIEAIEEVLEEGTNS